MGFLASWAQKASEGTATGRPQGSGRAEAGAIPVSSALEDIQQGAGPRGFGAASGSGPMEEAQAHARRCERALDAALGLDGHPAATLIETGALLAEFRARMNRMGEDRRAAARERQSALRSAIRSQQL